MISCNKWLMVGMSSAIQVVMHLIHVYRKSHSIGVLFVMLVEFHMCKVTLIFYILAVYLVYKYNII